MGKSRRFDVRQLLEFAGPEVVIDMVLELDREVSRLTKRVEEWREAAQTVADLFDPLRVAVSPASLVAVAKGAKAANEELRARLAGPRSEAPPDATREALERAAEAFHNIAHEGRSRAFTNGFTMTEEEVRECLRSCINIARHAKVAALAALAGPRSEAPPDAPGPKVLRYVSWEIADELHRLAQPLTDHVEAGKLACRVCDFLTPGAALVAGPRSEAGRETPDLASIERLVDAHGEARWQDGRYGLRLPHQESKDTRAALLSAIRSPAGRATTGTPEPTPAATAKPKED